MERTKSWEKITHTGLQIRQHWSKLAKEYSFDLNIKQARIITESIIKYIDTDLVCYRANEGTELEKIQKKLWDPYIKFCEKHYQLNYKKIYTVMPYSQEASNKDKILKIIDSMDKYYLTAFFF